MSEQPARRGRLAVLVAALVLLVVAGGSLLWDRAQPAPAPPAPPARSADTLSPTAREMAVAGLVREPGGRGVVLALQEKGRGRYLLLTIGEAEALAINLQLEGTTPPRPLTHDLMVQTLGELRTELARVVVTDLRDGTYFAHLVLRADGREVEVDARPSDAVALALRARAPIYAEAAVLERAAVSNEQTF